MPLTTVRFTRVFDRVDNKGRNGDSTVFSFESDAGTHYSVQAPGHPAIEPGMRVLAYLDKPDRWDTLVGWRNLDTGELAIDDGAEYWILIFMGVFFAVFGVIISHAPPWLWLGAVAFALLPLAALRKRRRVRRALADA